MALSAEPDRRIPILGPAGSPGSLDQMLVEAIGELGDGVILCDDTRVHWTNDAYCKLLGFTRDEVLSPDYRLLDRIAPEDRAAAQARSTEREQGKLHHRYDITLLRKDGTPVHCEIAVKTLAPDSKAPRIAIVRDVTRRTDNETRLAEQRDLYDALLRAESELGAGVILSRQDRSISYVNDAFARLAGRSVEELTAPGFDSMTLSPPEAIARLAKTLDLSDFAKPLHYQSALRRPNGELVDIEVASTGIMLSGKPHRIALCRDITTQLRATEARAREEAGLKARDEFLTHATLALLENSLDPDATLGLVARFAAEELGDYAVVELFEGEKDLRRVSIHHREAAKLEGVQHALRRVPTNPAVRALVEQIPRGEVAVRNDIPPTIVESYTPGDDEREIALALGVRHSMLVPLVGRSGVRGFLSVTRASGPGFTDAEVFVAKSLATRGALAHENAMLHREARELEARWRRLAQNHERVVQTAPVQILTIDGEGRIATINRSMRGPDAKRAIGISAYDTVVPEDRARVRAIIEDVMRTGGSAEYETRGILGPHETRWFSVRVAALNTENGRGAVLISTDIEERKRAERVLQESDARFRTLLAATTQMIWQTDKEGLIDDMPPWRAFTGQTRDGVRGTGWLDAVHPEDLERVKSTWAEAYGKRAVYSVDYRVRKHTGEYRWFLARGVPHFDANGELIEYIGTWTDIHDERIARQEAEGLRLELARSEKLSALGSLVGGVAHELRTPLTYLANNLYLINSAVGKAVEKLPSAEANDLKARLEMRLGEAHESIERIERIVEDLRKYTRLKLDTPRATAPLRHFATDAVHLFRATHKGEVQIHEDLGVTPAVSVDRVQVQQVILNLLQNALEAKPSDGAIYIRTREEQREAVLEVEDHGGGIPPEAAARMWEPFFTTKTEGTGLGLSVVRRILDAHGAKVEVDTKVGRGTIFRIRFPPA